MKSHVWRRSLPLILLSFSMLACTQRPKADEPAQADAALPIAETEDSTLYGVAGEHGMSSFCLITDAGDTLLMSRTAEDGTYGAFYGSVNEGDRYAVMTTDDREAVAKALNLTELGRFVKHFSITNGRPVFHGDERRDTVDIVQMNRDSLVVSYSDGHRATFYPVP